jgi:hypothetical protein
MTQSDSKKQTKGKKSHQSMSTEEAWPQDDEARAAAALDHLEDLRKFYQGEVTKYSYSYIILTIVTLVGSVLTPILLLYDFPQGSKYPKVIQALPSAIAGLAAAINSAFRFRESWVQNYYTLSALINEYQKFMVRATPDYGPEKAASDVVSNFQNNMSRFVMSEVESWRAVMLTSEAEAAARAEANKKTTE